MANNGNGKPLFLQGACCFCRTPLDEVRGAVMGSHGTICLECVLDCFDHATSEGLVKEGYLVLAVPRQTLRQWEANGLSARMLAHYVRRTIPKVRAPASEFFVALSRFLSKHIIARERRKEMLRGTDRMESRVVQWSQISPNGLLPGIQDVRDKLLRLDPLITAHIEVEGLDSTLTYNPTPGETIIKTAKRMVALAKRRKWAVRARFNNIWITANSSDDPNVIVEFYRSEELRRRERHVKIQVGSKSKKAKKGSDLLNLPSLPIS